MDFGIAGKRAAVAAASKGLGFAAAAALAAEGVQVAICSRDRSEIDAAAARIGPNAIPFVADVGTAAGAAQFLADANAALGGIDILVANAGGPPAGNFGLDRRHRRVRARLRAQRAVDDRDVSGHGSGHAGAAVGEGRGDHVDRGAPTHREPHPVEHRARGLTGFLKTLAREVAHDGVTVNSLQPGLHATERITGLYGDPTGLGAGVPAGRVGDPAAFGECVAFLCSESANYVTGTAIPVDGGADGGLQ